MAFFLLLVIVAIVLGIVGVVVNGLLYLLFVGIVVFSRLYLPRRPVEAPARRAKASRPVIPSGRP